MRDIQTIIARAKHVMRVLGKGHREHVYGKALQTSFHKAMIPYRAEVCCPIFFMDEIIGYGRADFVIDQYVIEIKANKLPITEASDQLEKYVKSLLRVEKKAYVGLLINFNQNTGEVNVLQQKDREVKRPSGVKSRFFMNKDKK